MATRPLLKSCEQCRKGKAKCFPSPSGLCQRCGRLGKECVFREFRVRAGQTNQCSRCPGSTTRENDTQRINELHGLVPRPPHDDSSTGIGRATYDTFIPDSDKRSNVSSPRQGLYTTTAPADTASSSDFDVIDRGMLSSSYAEQLLEAYKTMSSNFPFVLVPQNCSLEDLRKDRPCVLLAAFVMASEADPKFQSIIERQYREGLSRRAIVEGGKSIDLLQSLLIYLAWYHFHFEPQRQQIHQLVGLSVGMIVDLVISHPEQRHASKHETVVCQALEAKRALLGCWYLSSCLSIAFRKPNLLQYSAVIDVSCNEILSANEYSTDRAIPNFLRVQRLAEEVHDAFGYAGDLRSCYLSSERLRLSVKSFQYRLDGLLLDFPSDTPGRPAFMVLYHATAIYIHEVCLHLNNNASTSSLASVHDAQARSTPWMSPHLIMGCLEAVEKGLEYIINLPQTEIRRFTIMEFARLTYAIIVLEKLSGGVDLGLDTEILREAVSLNKYLDALIQIMDALTFANIENNTRDIYWHFRCVCERIKVSHQRRLQSKNVARIEGGLYLNPMQFAEDHDVPVDDNAGSQDIRTETKPGAAMDICDDFWDELLAAWPTYGTTVLEH